MSSSKVKKLTKKELLSKLGGKQAGKNDWTICSAPCLTDCYGVGTRKGSFMKANPEPAHGSGRPTRDMPVRNQLYKKK
jgi:hypothetical protein